MITSKFDLYKAEWLDLVFENRNKDYGAYYLRQHYAGNMVRAMGFTFLGITTLFIATVVFKNKPAAPILTPHEQLIPVNLTPVRPPEAPPKRVEPPKQTSPVKMTQNLPPVVKPDNLVKTKPVENDKL